MISSGWVLPWYGVLSVDHEILLAWKKPVFIISMHLMWYREVSINLESLGTRRIIVGDTCGVHLIFGRSCIVQVVTSDNSETTNVHNTFEFNSGLRAELFSRHW